MAARWRVRTSSVSSAGRVMAGIPPSGCGRSSGGGHGRWSARLAAVRLGAGRRFLGVVWRCGHPAGRPGGGGGVGIWRRVGGEGAAGGGGGRPGRRAGRGGGGG